MSIPSIHGELSLFSCDTQFSLDITVTHEHFPSKVMSPSKITVADHQPAFNDTPPCGDIWGASRSRKSSESGRAAALARRRSLVLSRITANVLPPPVPDADQSIVRTPLVRLSISVHQSEREENSRSQPSGASPGTVDVHIGQDFSSGNCDALSSPEHEPSHSTDTFWDPFSSGLIPDTRFPTSHVRTVNVDCQDEPLTYSPRLLSPALIHSAPPDITTHSSSIPVTLLREPSVANSPSMHTAEAFPDSPLTCISSLKSESDLHETFEDDLPAHAASNSPDEITPPCTPTPPPVKDKRKGASLPKRKGKRKGHCSDGVQSVRASKRSRASSSHYWCLYRTCQSFFSNCKDRDRHRDGHFPDRWACPKCRRSFQRGDALKRHILTGTNLNCLSAAGGAKEVKRLNSMKRFCIRERPWWMDEPYKSELRPEAS